ncbi:MAG: hypothetical protein ACRDJG_02095 [Actinomycetota bacterium]
MAMVVLAVVLGILLPRLQEERSPPANGKQDPKAEVENAYLAYWNAVKQAYLKLDVSLLADWTTPGARESVGKAIERDRQNGNPVREFATNHDYRIVVYREGDIASVDDVYELHRALLDPQSLKPVEEEATLTFHDSFVMRRIDGQWKVDGDVVFGTGRPTPETDVSQAAVSSGNPVPETLRNEVESAYLSYWAASAKAYRELDPAPLHRVLSGPALEKDLSVLNEQREKNQRFLINVEHNYRIAADGSESVYVYDTVADRSVFVDKVTGKQVRAERIDIFRFGYVLRKVEGRWKVDFIKQLE